MNICGIHINKKIVSCRLPKLHNYPHKKISLVCFHLDGRKKWYLSQFLVCSSFSFQNPKWESDKFLVRAASASGSLSDSASEYPDQVLGSKPKGRTRRVAGIDQDEIEDPRTLADSDSCFCEFNGVQLHHKIASLNEDCLDGSDSQSSEQSEIADKYPMILLHGFGASIFSWNRVMKPLAKAIGSKVLAFDRPAFGLTPRINSSANYSSSGDQVTRPLNPYSPMFSALATLFFIDFLAAQKAIIVGKQSFVVGRPKSETEHSAGGLVAVDAYFEAPERVAALILVAPAILAPFTTQITGKQNGGGNNNQDQGNGSASDTGGNVFLKIFRILSMFSRFIAQAIVRMVKGMSDMINSLYKRTLSTILRSSLGVMLIRMIIDKFGIPAICMSWYDSKVSDHVLQGYTKPLKVKGWDKALAEYTIAMLTDAASNMKPPLTKRLAEISCPVLIVTGDTDRLVPSWNAERLSQAIPGARLEIIKNCGHLPQEEKPEEFVSIVDKFLQGIFGAAEEPHLQMAT